MKRAAPKSGSPREIFVLTPEEKRTVAFVLVIFVLGLATAHYRATHTVPRAQIAVEETAGATARPAAKRAETKRPKPPK